MRADIHDGPEQKLQSEAGYIDARPQTDNSTKTSCNARPDHRCGSISDSASLSCGQISDPAYLNSCPYLRAIALICCRVNSFRGSPGRKEAVEARRHHDPQQNQFLIWTAETMPRVLGYENRSTSF